MRHFPSTGLVKKSVFGGKSPHLTAPFPDTTIKAILELGYAPRKLTPVHLARHLYVGHESRDGSSLDSDSAKGFLSMVRLPNLIASCLERLSHIYGSEWLDIFLPILDIFLPIEDAGNALQPQDNRYQGARRPRKGGRQSAIDEG
jgi:hypothetical protein